MFRRAFLVTALAVTGCQCGDDALTTASAKLEVTPLMLDFGDIPLGNLRILSAEVNSAGTLGITITSTLAQMTGEFSLASVIPTALGPQQKATVNVVYEPTDLGEDRGTITFSANDERGPIVVGLRGVGVLSGAGLELEGDGCPGVADSLAFGATAPGTPVERRITITSVGGADLEILSAIVEPGSSAEWSIDGSMLPKTLASGMSIELVATYNPADGGADTGAFIITTNSQTMPSIRIPACGSGIAPALCARPVPLDIGAVAVGATRSGRMTLESCGLLPLQLSTVALAHDPMHMSGPNFTLTTPLALPLTLAPGATVDVDIEYAGRLPYGAAQAWVTATSNALVQPTSFFPVIARTASPCSLFVAPGTLNYRGVAAGMSATHTALIGNAGESTCGVDSLVVTSSSAYFALVGTSTGFTLAAGDARTVDVRYAPLMAGTHEGLLVVTDTGGSTLAVDLRGNPPEPAGCVLEVTPALANFGVVPIGSMPHLAVRATAIGDSACRVTNARLLGSNPVFALTLPALRTAFPGIGGVNIDIAYSPMTAGASSDVIQIDYAPTGAGVGGGTVLVGVTGLAAEGRICVTPPIVDFGAVSAGNTAMRTIDISSCGSADVQLRGVVLAAGNPEFRISRAPTLPARLAAGAHGAPVLEVSYSPTGGGPHFGQIEILSSDTRTPTVRVPLQGNFASGCTEILQCRPETIAFGDTVVGTDKIVRVVCRSLGSAPVTISSVTLAGGAGLSVNAPTPVSLQPGAAWSFDVHYAPQSTVAVSATLSIASNACEAPDTSMVTGVGIEPVIPPCLPPMAFAPQTQWVWNASTVEPTFTNVWSTPLVANLDDDNADGHIDENDIPDVVFISIDNYSIADPAGSVPGVIRVLSGDTGREKFSVTSPRFADTAIPAIGDLDGDGRPEIVGIKWVQTPMGMGMGGFFGRYTTGTIVALDNTGRLLWESDPYQYPPEVTFNAGAIEIADLDADGFAEVILGRDVFDHRGRLKWRGAADFGLASAGAHSIVADIDLDGRPEVIAGGTVYNYDGSIKWEIQRVRDGGTAVGMLDPTDPFPQIVIQMVTEIIVVDHNGMEKWHEQIPSMGARTMLPTLADFDGDGDADIAVADGEMMHVLYGTGGYIWNAPVTDSTCCAGISAFDFEGDRIYELILNDNGNVYVYRGSDGTQIFRADRINPTAFEMPVVADIDNDSKAELLVALFGPRGAGGITAYSNVGDNWVGAPRIFNQQSYHVTNVYESGAIPRVETPLPQGPRVFRGNSASCR